MRIFKDLEGIGKDKERKTKEGDLEILLGIFESIRKKTDYNHEDLEEDPVSVYNQMVNLVRLSTQNSRIITQHSLKDFVNMNFDSSYCIDEKKFMGIFTGCLLTLLTEYNQRENKRTQIVIEGHGKKFDNLFSCARNVDELVLSNIKGNQICSNVASYNGKANILVMDRIQGSETLKEAGGIGGVINGISLTNCYGERNLSSVGFSQGKIGSIIAKDNKGGLLCSGAAINNGEIKLLIVDNHVGDLTGYLMGIGGNIENAIFKNTFKRYKPYDIIRFAVQNLFTDQEYLVGNKSSATQKNCIYLKNLGDKRHKEIREITDIDSKIDGKSYLNTIESLNLMNLLIERYNNGQP